MEAVVAVVAAVVAVVGIVTAAVVAVVAVAVVAADFGEKWLNKCWLIEFGGVNERKKSESLFVGKFDFYQQTNVRWHL